MNRPLTYLSLFSSAGVGCHGFKQQGFKCIATNALLPEHLKIQRFIGKCGYDSGYIGGSITDPKVKKLLFKEIEFWKKNHGVKSPDVLIATPPCEGMSVANHKKNNELSRNSLVVESMKLTHKILPKYFVFENVRAFLKTVCTDADGQDKPIGEAIRYNLGGHYNMLSKVINLKKYGSNSRLIRTLVVGVRKDIQNISPYDIFPKKQSAKTLQHITEDLPTLIEMVGLKGLSIRPRVGEAPSTGVFHSIALNIKSVDKKESLPISEIKSLEKEHGLYKTENLVDFINSKFSKYSLETIFLITEHSNSERQRTSAYFTRKDIAYSVVKDLPELKEKKKIRILEPSVGVGNFIPLLFQKYADKEEVILDVCDIDNNSLRVLQTILSKLKVPRNFKIKFKNVDFLLWDCSTKYDIVVGNPPYGKIAGNKELLAKYRQEVFNANTTNVFSFFIEKALDLGNHVSLIVPKSLLNAPEFNKTRELLLSSNLQKICDYGEKAFKGVKIETVSFLCASGAIEEKVTIESYIRNTYKQEKKAYIFSKDFPYWLIYRNESFDRIASKMDLDIFKSFRDRQITKRLTRNRGKIRVLKSRNIGNNEIKEIVGYDCYVNKIDDLAVSKYYNAPDVVMVPNLTYYPRASFLPSNAIADGSVALLTLKNGSRLPTTNDLEFYSTKEFEDYYRIARNYGTRSLNIDNNSVFFFGLLKDKINV